MSEELMSNGTFIKKKVESQSMRREMETHPSTGGFTWSDNRFST